MPGDIKIFSKRERDNFGAGSIDWELDGASFKVLKNKEEIIEQALLKSIISPMTDYGYGVNVKEFRGTKHIIPVRVAVAVRLQRSLEWINEWYEENVKIKKITISHSLDSFLVELQFERTKKEILFGLERIEV